MKRAIVLVLMLVFLLALPAYAYANLEDKLENHWLKDEMDKDFFLYYFSYLAREDFKRFNPQEAIREDEFLLSFSSLLKNKGYSTVELDFGSSIKRINMVKVVGNKLAEIINHTSKDIELPFTDIESISVEEREALKLLYSLGIIKGQSSAKFNPNSNTSQAEAIVVLQRVRDYLDSLNAERKEIPFKLLGIVETYTGAEGIRSRLEGDKVIVTITKMFPTPGYTVKVEKIVYEKGLYKIYLDISPPDPDRFLPQVIVYKTITIEIDKEQLIDAPYNFIWG
ncbi:MAG: hypothetical protein GXZ06_01000 [Tissierellia bacterium]|nr:hypothetical protein [Tissierellia bacterium]